MPLPETPSTVLQSPGAREVVTDPRSISLGLSSLERSMGKREPLPAQMSELDVRSMREGLSDPATMRIVDFRSFLRLNEATARVKAAQFEMKASRQPLTKEDRAEWILANRQATYLEYLPATIEQLTGAMRLYEQDVLDVLPALPAKERAELSADRERVVLYLQHLQSLLAECTTLAALNEVSIKLGAARGGAELYKEHQKTLEDKRMSLLALLQPESRDAFIAYEQEFERFRAAKTPNERRKILAGDASKTFEEYRLSLEQKIIAALKGEATIDVPGLPKDFLPQRAYIKLLQARYTQLLEIQTEIAGSGQSIEQIKAAQAELGAMRRDAMQRLLTLTRHLESHQLSALELASIQNQFDTDIDQGRHVSAPYNASSPQSVHAFAERIFEGENGKPGAKGFHLDRLEDMLAKADAAFSPSLVEQLKEQSGLKSTEMADAISKAIRSVITLDGLTPGAETNTVAAWFDSVFPLYLNESLQAGVTADGKVATKEEKLQRLAKVIVAFRETGAVERFKKTITLIRSLPSSADAVGEDVQEDVVAALAAGTFEGNPQGQTVLVNGKEVRVNGATAYALLFQQLNRDSDDFLESYKEFLGEMDRVVDLRLGLIAEKNIIQANWGKLATVLGSGSALLYGTSLLAPTLLKKAPGWTKNTIESGYRLSSSEVTPFLALQGARTYLDYQQWNETAESIRGDRMRMIAELRASGFAPDPTRNDVFTYDHDGVQCTVSIQELNASLRGQEMANAVRTLASGAELAYLTRAAFLTTGKQTAKAGARMMGRAIPAMLAVEVVVETYIYTKNQAANREFVGKCPPWLLVKLATKQTQVLNSAGDIRQQTSLQQTIGVSPYELLSSVSEPLLSSYLVEHSEGNKQDLRKKMVFVILHKELEEFPELLRGLYPSGQSATSMDDLYSHDFEDVFLKFFRARVFQVAKGNVSWDQVMEGRISGDSYVPQVGVRGETPDTTEFDVRAAVREAAALTVAHMKEKQYRQAVHARNRYAKVPTEQQERIVQSLLDEAVETYGAETGMGKPLRDMELDRDETRIQRIADRLYAQAAMGDYSVELSDISGVSGSIDFSDRSAVLRAFVDDTVLQLRLQEQHALTVGEQEEKELHDAWSGTPYHLRIVADQLAQNLAQPRLSNGFNVDTEISFAQAASDSVRKAVRRSSLRPPHSIFNVLGTGKDQPTAAVLRSSITQGVTELIETEKGSEKHRAFMKREQSFEQAFGVRASVFIEGSPSDSVCRDILSSAKSLEQDLGPIHAVLFEGRHLPSGTNHEAVLATFAFLDPNTKDMTIAQVGAAHGSVAGIRGERDVVGSFVFPDRRTLQEKPGMRMFLQNIATAAADRVREGVIARKSRDSAISQAEHTWDRAAPEREKLITEREELRNRRIALAATSPEFLYIPGSYTSNDQQRVFIEQVGDFRAAIDGYDVMIPAPSFRSDKSISARTEGTLTPMPFTFTASKNGVTHPYVVTMEVFRTNPEQLTEEEVALARHVLTAHMNLDGHPAASNAEYVRSIRFSELSHIIDGATFQSTYNASAEGVRTKFMSEMLQAYEACPAQQRPAFLGALIKNLTDSSQKPITWHRFSWGTYGAIRDRMRSAGK